MILNDSFLADAGWLFFAAWSAVVAAVSIVAFGRDLLPWNAHFDSTPKPQSSDRVRPTHHRALVLKSTRPIPVSQAPPYRINEH